MYVFSYNNRYVQKVTKRVRSCLGVVDTTSLVPRDPEFNPNSSSLSDETKPWPCLQMTFAVGGTLNTSSITHKEDYEVKDEN